MTNMNNAIVEITNDEQAKEIFQCVKKYYENQNPNARCCLNYYIYEGEKKKQITQSLKNKYKNDPEYKERKLAYAKIQNEQRKEERKKKRDEKKENNKKSDS